MNKPLPEVIEMNPSSKPQPFLLRMAATFFSYSFHPLFIPLYIVAILVYRHPYLFASATDWEKVRVLLQMFVNCTFLPLVSVLLLRGLGFIESIFLQSQKERIIPYIISMIFYFWNWYAFKNNLAMPELVGFTLALFVASILGFLVNIFMKISMHAMAVATMSCFLAWLSLKEGEPFIVYLIMAILITGIVCTARLLVSNHNRQQIYMGLAVGALSQGIAIFFV